MDAPWIELVRSKDQNESGGPVPVNLEWQALFACQIHIPDFKSWESMKWGFNAEALFHESMDRQRAFFESQFGINQELRMEDPARRTLALRLIGQPDGRLLCALLGKICADTEASAHTAAMGYLRSLQASIPYEYSLVPAASEAQFRKLSGLDILLQTEVGTSLTQIQRCVMPLPPGRKPPFLQGHWISAPHGHEQIWRAISSWPAPLLVNFTMRSTILVESEVQRLEMFVDQVNRLENPAMNKRLLTGFKAGHQASLERMTAPGQRLFYLQVHMASSGQIDEHFARTLGNALTFGASDKASPGYQLSYARPEEMAAWQSALRRLDIIATGNYPPIPRLSEIGDMEEVLAVMRIPYCPPGEDLHHMKFAELETR